MMLTIIMIKVLPYLLASPRVDLDTRDNRKRSEKDAVKYVRNNMNECLVHHHSIYSSKVCEDAH